MLNFLRKFRYFDQPLQTVTLLLAVAGMAMLYSIAAAESGGTSVFWKQGLFLAAGLGLYIFFAFFDYHTLAKLNRVVYPVLLILLVYLLLFGPKINGGRRWLSLGFSTLQLGEFVKISIMLGLARLLYLRGGQINSFGRIAWSLVYALVPAALIVAEPDLGSAIVIVGLWAGLLIMSPIQKKYLAVLFIGFVLVSGITWKFFLKDFQRSRIEVFLNPALDPHGRGYNVRQATIAVGSGQIFGSGLGKGAQSQNKFLPEQETDFIFAAAAEEIGFLGCAALLALYLFLLFRLLRIARHAKDDLGLYLAGGVFFILAIHVAINVGMNIGLLPVTGIPLPLASAGGSSLLATLIALGIAQNVCLQSKALRF